MAKQIIECPKCESDNLLATGQDWEGDTHYKCQTCGEKLFVTIRSVD